MIRELASEDEIYKYFLKVLKEKFHRRLGYECEEIEFLNTELIPQGIDRKYMDCHYRVDGKSKHNQEFQSTPVYYPKMLDIFKYMVDSEAEEFTEFSTYILATYNPNQGIRELEFGDVIFKPKFFFTKNLNASETIKNVKNKNKKHIPLTDNEAIDLLLTPDMTHDYKIKELLEITSELLVKAKISDKEFHKSLLDC